jgi:H+/Cl- antiporter ClcA
MNEIPQTTKNSTGTTTYRGTATLDGIAVSAAALAGFLALLVAPTVTVGAGIGAIALKGIQKLKDTETPTAPPPEDGFGGDTQTP